MNRLIFCQHAIFLSVVVGVSHCFLLFLQLNELIEHVLHALEALFVRRYFFVELIDRAGEIVVLPLEALGRALLLLLVLLHLLEQLAHLRVLARLLLSEQVIEVLDHSTLELLLKRLTILDQVVKFFDLFVVLCVNGLLDDVRCLLLIFAVVIAGIVVNRRWPRQSGVWIEGL